MSLQLVLPVSWLASGRHLLRHPAQLALALLGLALGVGTLVAVDIATSSAQRAFRLSLEAVNGTTTQQITGGPAGLDEQLYVQLRREPPRTAGARVIAAPVVAGYATVGGHALQLLGIDPFASAELDPRGALRLATVSGGAGGGARSLQDWMAGRGAVLLSAATARSLGLARGAPLRVQIAGADHAARLTGLLDAPGTEALLVTDISQAQAWLGMSGRLTRIDLRVPDRADSAALLAAVRARLPPGAQLQDARARERASLDMTRAFTTNLTAMSLLALLVSSFLIYGAMSFAVLQRRRTLGILRALGATRAEVLCRVLAEAAVLGGLGSLLGVLLGSLLGHELVRLVSRTINDLYFVVAVNATPVSATAVLRAVLAGFGTAMLGALVPAVEVARGAPQLGLRRSALEAGVRRLARRLLPASLLLAAGAAGAILLPGQSLLAGFVSLFLLLLAVSAATPAILRASATGAARLVGQRSPVARLALGEVAASLSRTGVAVAALGMALAAMIGVSIMVASFRESLRGWLTRTLAADVYVSAPGPSINSPERRLDPELLAGIGQLPGVAAVARTRRVTVDSPRGPVALDAHFRAPGHAPQLQISSGDARHWQDALDAGAVLVSEPFAFRTGVGAGAQLVLATAQGPRSFHVAAVYREYGNDRGAVMIDGAHYARLWNDGAVSGLALYLAPGARAADTMAAIRALAQGRQALLIRSNADIRELSLQIFERTFVITRVLYILAAGVAAVGLVSALLAWELERAHELALLRALGLTPRATALLIELQTGFLGLSALLAAVPAGLLTALVLTEVINRRAFGWHIDLHLSGAQFGNALLLALVAALAAGLYPAWRAAVAPLTDSMREE